MSEDKRKGGGAKTSRSETVTVRLSPYARYLADIAARLQRRTLSSYIEWAVEQSLRSVEMDKHATGESISVAQVDAMQHLWDPVEADCFVKLAALYPNLLTHEEQLLWKLIREVIGMSKPGVAPDKWELPDFEILRTNWDLLKDAAAGGAMPSHVAAAIAGDGATAQSIEKLAEQATTNAEKLDRIRALETARLAMMPARPVKVRRPKNEE